MLEFTCVIAGRLAPGCSVRAVPTSFVSTTRAGLSAVAGGGGSDQQEKYRLGGRHRARSDGPHDLLDEADVLVTGYRPGWPRRLGLDPDQSPNSTWAPWSSHSQLGTVGPWGSRRGFDSLVQIATGIGWATGLDGIWPGVAVPTTRPRHRILARRRSAAGHDRKSPHGRGAARAALPPGPRNGCSNRACSPARTPAPTRHQASRIASRSVTDRPALPRPVDSTLRR